MAIAFLPSVIYHIQAVLILIVPASYVPGTRYHTTWCRHGCDVKEMGTLFVILLLIRVSATIAIRTCCLHFVRACFGDVAS